MRRFILPLVAAASIAMPFAAMAELPPDVAAEIVKMGHVNDPRTSKVFAPLHKAPGTVWQSTAPGADTALGSGLALP